MNIFFLKKLKLKKRQFIGVFFLLFACLSFISLVSFNPTDLSWFYFDSQNNIIINKLGAFGSNLASSLLYIFGLSSFAFLFFLIYFSLFLIKKISFKLEWERFLAFCCLILSICTLSKYHKIVLFNKSCDGAGIIGNLIYRNIVSKFNADISIVFIYNILIVSMILISRLNFVLIGRQIKLKKIVYCCSYIFKCLQKVKNVVVFPFQKSYQFIHSLINPIEDFDELLFEEEYAQLLQDFDSNFLDNSSYDILSNLAEPKKDKKSSEIKNEQIKVSNKLKETAGLEETIFLLPNLENIFISNNENYDNKKLVKEAEIQSKILDEKLQCFGISGTVTAIKYGPVVTMFEYEPHINSKISKIIALEDDLAMALETTSIRIIAPIPGKSVIGFEVANKYRKNVSISPIIRSSAYKNFSGQLPLILGDDIVGNKVLVDLVKMPHLLIAGSTGSGKSVALNTMIISLLCKSNPDELKLILIDPKRLEFAAYADIPHLLFPIIILPKYAAGVLKWLTHEMENRYEMMSKTGSKNILDYNIFCQQNNQKKLPYIVIIIDELADLMMTGGKEIEESIIRLAQMARACGIHMIVATQRPSVDVITGLIKVNFPSRISFKVASKFDSRIILDCNGADKLLGKGDMLFLNSQSSHLERIHGAFVSDEEIVKIVEHIRLQQQVKYLNLTDLFVTKQNEISDADDELYKEIVNYLKEIDEVSISLLQRRFKIGFNRSARIIELLESHGHVLPCQGGKARKIIKAQK